MDERVLQALRGMAWERAKGEIEAMLTTFYGGADDAYDGLFKTFHDFVKEVEGNGWHE